MRRPLTSFEPLDVVAVPFPFVERPVTVRRPSVVLARPPSGNRHPLLWVMMITSAENERWPGDIVISDLRAAGLPEPSVIRPAKMAVIEALGLERKGRLADADAAALRLGLRGLVQPLLSQAP
jgi:mRNA interferase MazF